MNLKLAAKQKVRFARVEQANRWLIVAVLLEERGDETVVISEPKVVKIILKAQKLALNGSNARLGTPKISEIISTAKKISSPYAGLIFGYANAGMVMGLGAQPPTGK